MHSLGLHEYWAECWFQILALVRFCQKLAYMSADRTCGEFKGEITWSPLNFHTTMTFMEEMLSTHSTNLALPWSACDVYDALLREVGMVSKVLVL